MGSAASIEHEGEMSEEEKQLQAQASANWYRMMHFFAENRELINGNKDEELSGLKEMSSENIDLPVRRILDAGGKKYYRRTLSNISTEHEPEIPRSVSMNALSRVSPSPLRSTRSEDSPHSVKSAPGEKMSRSPSKRDMEQHRHNEKSINSLKKVKIDLKSRTSTSLTIIYDVDFEALSILQSLKDELNNAILPLYEVSYKHASAMESQWKSCPKTTDTQLTLSNLTPNTQYAVRCRRQWSEDWSPVVLIRTGPGSPSPPTSLHAREVTSTSILIHWSPPKRDNGLPIVGYTLRMKLLGTDLAIVYQGKDRVHLAVGLLPNTVYVFEAAAVNKAGEGVGCDRLAIRTLPEGAPPMTPWVECIDDTGHIYYYHQKTQASAWTLPQGALVDTKISFQNKHAYLQAKFRRSFQSSCRAAGVDFMPNYLTISRTNLLEDSLRQLHRITPSRLVSGPIRIKIVNEDGVDGGGIAKDWSIELAKKLIQESAGLMIQSDAGVILDQRSNVFHGNECRWLFKSLGIFFAKCIYDNHVTGLTFHPLFLMWLQDITPTMADLQSFDESFYRSLQWVLENDVSEADFTFSASFELYDIPHTVELVHNGLQKAVTETNKREYVEYMLNWLFKERYEPGLSYFKEGFHSIIFHTDMQLFNVQELQSLLGGSVEINLRELTSSAVLNGYTAECVQIKWLWRLFDTCDIDTLCSIIRFITGCPSLPPDGLKPPLNITRSDVADVNAPPLPVSHTCFNQLVLPAYNSYEVLQEKLLYAVKHCETGFYIQ